MGNDNVSRVTNKTQVNPIYFCYSYHQHTYLQAQGLQLIGVGINENSGRKFWQYLRGADLDVLLDQWTANRPQ